jgi:hypothetical protein
MMGERSLHQPPGHLLARPSLPDNLEWADAVHCSAG